MSRPFNKGQQKRGGLPEQQSVMRFVEMIAARQE